MIDIPVPPTHCESKQAFAEIVMVHVNNADLRKIRSAYKVYGKGKHRKVLRKALDNYMQHKPLTVSEFGIKIFGECEDE